MSLIIKGMSLPKHVAVNGEKDIAYKCVIVVTKRDIDCAPTINEAEVSE